MPATALIIHPNGEQQRLPWPAESRAQIEIVQMAVGGWAERLPCAFHAMMNHDAWLSEDGHGQEPNWPAHRAIGMSSEYEPPCGPVVLTLLPEGFDQVGQRAHQCEYFGVLDAVALGLVSEAEVGLGTIIDLREMG
jgi:hypothetical protein